MRNPLGAYSGSLRFLLIIIFFFTLTSNGCKKLDPVRVLKVETESVTAVSHTSSIANGKIIDVATGTITHGFCYSTNPEPTLDAGILVAPQVALQSAGAFTAEVSGLSPGTTYYLKAYLDVSGETVYGAQAMFTTLEAKSPQVSTRVISSITATSAQSGGTVVDEGGSAVISRGICWNASGDPDLNDSKTQNGSGTGSFTSNLTSLSPETTYYVRAYATNSSGTGYGDELTFLSANSNSLPSVTTSAISDITENSAVGGGNVTEDGGLTITLRGVCWSTSSNPTILDDNSWVSGGTGSYAVPLSGLTENTKYYVRAFATNDEGTAYGAEVTFTTNSPLATVTDYDGNIYNIKTIGSQTWMVENLKVTHYADGTAIPLVENSSTWEAMGFDDQRYCYYNNSESNADPYGVLYSWAAVMYGASASASNPSGIQGVCPDGWHVPSDAEFGQLEMHLGMSSSEVENKDWRGTDEGGKLKEAGLDHWDSPNTGATNSSGFTLLPGGMRDLEGDFRNITRNAYIWTTSEENSSRGWSRHISWDYDKIYRYGSYKDYGFSVRCLKDD